MDMAEDYFNRLELTLTPDKKQLIVPTWRQDIHRNADVAEELARFFGYANIPTTLPKTGSTAGGETFKMEVDDKARELACQFGFCEAMTYSFESPKVFDKLRLDKDDPMRNAIKIMNPLGEDFSIMRTSTINGMLNSLSTNFKRKNKEARLFEISNIYIAESLPLGHEYPDERKQFMLGMYDAGDFFTLKGVVEEFLYKVGMKKSVEYDGTPAKNFLHPGRQASIIYDGQTIGYIGEVHPLVLDN